MSYLLCQDEHVVGVFTDLNKCKDTIEGIEQNNWATNFKIIEFKTNTCCKIGEINFESQYNNSSNVTDNQNQDNDSANIEDMNNEDKVNIKALQHNINLLKVQKEKIEESKQKYKIDLNLYKKFSEELSRDINFLIPDLFEHKFKIFQELEKDGEITWEKFSKLYKEEDYNGISKNIFEDINSYENNFLTKIENSSDDTEIETNSNSDQFTSDETDNEIEIIEVMESTTDETSSSEY